MRISRKCQWVTRPAVVSAFAAAAIALSTPVSAESLTISVWGGGYGEAWKKHVVAPFVKKTGIKVVLDLGRSSQRLSKLIATRGGGVDLIFLTDHQMAVAKQRGLLEPVDPKKIPNMANLYPFAKDPLGGGLCPAITLLGVGLAYNKNLYKTPPTSWLELARTNLPAKAAFMDISFSVAPSVMVRLSELKGGSIKNMNPGFKLLSDRKKSAKFFRLFEVIDWINRGEVAVAPMLNIFAKKDPKLALRFVYPKDGILGVVNMACIVKGSRNKATAEKFLNYYLSPEVQETQAKTFGETPVVTNAKVPTGGRIELVPASRFNELIIYNPDTIAKNRAKWMQRFQDEVVAR